MSDVETRATATSFPAGVDKADDIESVGAIPNRSKMAEEEGEKKMQNFWSESPLEWVEGSRNDCERKPKKSIDIII